MSKASILKARLAPFLALYGNMAMVKRWIIHRPIRHIVRGFNFEQTSTPNSHHIYWNLWHAFDPHPRIELSIGNFIFPRDSDRGLYDDAPDFCDRLALAIEPEVMEILKAHDSISEYDKFAQRNDLLSWSWMREFPLRQVAVDAALGRFDLVLEACKLLEDRPSFSRFADLEPARQAIMTELRPAAAADDRAAVAAVLHRWERRNMNLLKLEKFWEPSPFPIEQPGWIAPPPFPKQLLYNSAKK